MLNPLNQSYGSTDIQLTFILDQNATHMAYSLDGQANVTIVGNVTLPHYPTVHTT